MKNNKNRIVLNAAFGYANPTGLEIYPYEMVVKLLKVESEFVLLPFQVLLLYIRFCKGSTSRRMARRQQRYVTEGDLV